MIFAIHKKKRKNKQTKIQETTEGTNLHNGLSDSTPSVNWSLLLYQHVSTGTSLKQQKPGVDCTHTMKVSRLNYTAGQKFPTRVSDPVNDRNVCDLKKPGMFIWALKSTLQFGPCTRRTLCIIRSLQL